MIHPTICPQCQQPNESDRIYCWKCNRSFQTPPTAGDYERLFDLRPGWTLEDLKRAYHREAMQSHPDKHPGDKEADAKFQFVNRAYEELCELNGHHVISYRPENRTPPARPTSDPDLDRLAEALRSYYSSRYLDMESFGPYYKVAIMAILVIVGFYVIAEWSVHHFVGKP